MADALLNRLPPDDIWREAVAFFANYLISTRVFPFLDVVDENKLVFGVLEQGLSGASQAVVF